MSIQRYSIVGASPSAISAVGGTNLSEKPLIGVVFAHLTDEQAKKLAGIPGVNVKVVGKVSTSVRVPTPVPASAFLSLSPEVMIEQSELDKFRKSWGPIPLYGQGVTVAVVDTGVRTTHSSLGGKVVYSENFSSSPTTDDVFNHGTGVAHIIHAMAPEANILNMRIIGDDGECTEEQVVNAIERCVEMKVQGHQYAPVLINLSVGAEDSGNPNDVMRVACRVATMEYNLWIVAAAGNNGPNPGTIDCPACEQYVMAVGSCSLPDYVVNDFSSRGPTKEGLIKPDILMPGNDVLVASSASDVATIAKSGTSFAAPFVTSIGIWFKQGVKIYTEPSAYIIAAAPYFRIYAVNIDPTMVDVIDHYMPIGGIKPGDVLTATHLSTKDNDYGYGTMFAPLAVEYLTAGLESDIKSLVGLDIGAMINMFMPIIVLGMVANFTRSMLKASSKKKVGLKYT